MNTETLSVPTREQKVLDIFKQHVAAFTSGDLDAVLNDFGEHPVLITPDGAFEGRDRIHAFYRGLLVEFGVIDRGDSPGFTFDAVHVWNNMLFIAWHAESMCHSFPFGTDTFVCEGGKIHRQTVAFSPPRPRTAQPCDERG